MPPLEHPASGPVALTAPLRAWTVSALDLLFPALCPVCGVPLDEGRRDPLCGACWAALPRLGPPCCPRCGCPQPDAAGEPAASARLCGACARQAPPFDWARAAARFDGPAREALHALKFGGRRALARPLADLVAEQWGARIAADAVLVPVPLGAARARERGYNQAALVAERLAARLGVPVRARWLARRLATRPQSELPAAERADNVRGAFTARPDAAGARVVLVDDVLTTGATAGECARALRAAGAAEVGVLTVARVV